MFSNANVVKNARKASARTGYEMDTPKGAKRDAKRVNRKAAVASKREAGWL